MDSGVLQGSEVGIFYDPMISKLIVHGESRAVAVKKLKKALRDYKIGGLVTNIPFLQRVIDNPEFEAFDYNLQFIDKYMDTLVPEGITVDNPTLATLVILSAFYDQKAETSGLPKDLRNFRINH